MTDRNKQFSVLIAEDDLVQQKLITHYLMELNLNVVSAVSSGERLIEECKKYKPDIVVLDIGLNRKNGIMAMKEVNASGLYPQIIIVTGSTDTNHMIEGIELRTNGYILKPVQKSKLLEALELAIKHVKEKRLISHVTIDQTQIYWIKCKEQFKKVDIAESQIVYIKKEDRNLTSIHLLDGKTIRTTSSLKELLEQQHSTIFQTHKSFLVNLIHIKSVFASIEIVGNYDISLLGCSIIIPLTKRKYSNYLQTKVSYTKTGPTDFISNGMPI